MKQLKTIAATGLALAIAAQAGEGAFSLKGNVQLLGEKALWNAEGTSSDSLFNKTYLRAHFGAGYKSDDVTAEFNIRMLGPNFGNTAIDKIEKDGTVKTKAIDNFMIEKAFVEQALPKNIKVKAGRWSTETSVNGHFGNYMDQNPWSSSNSGAYFLSRPVFHDAMEVTHKEGVLASSVMIGTTDKNLNTGYLRIVETVTIPQAKLTLTAGYRANVLDSISTPDNKAKLYHRIYGKIVDTLPMGFVPYVEGALLDLTDNNAKLNGKLVEEMMGVANIGLVFPTIKATGTVIAIEAEIEKDRKVGSEERPWDFNIAITQPVGKNTKIQWYTFSDPSAEKVTDLKTGMRVTMEVK